MFENTLSIMIFLPIVAGLALMVLPVGREAARAAGLVVAVLVVILGLKVFINFTGAGGLEFVEKTSWFAYVGVNYSLGVDGISLLVLLAGACLFPMVYLLLKTKSKGFYANLLLTQGAMIGAIAAADMVLFYIFWEVMLLPIFFMIGLFGGPNRLPATLKITLYTIAGSLLMLAAIVYVGVSYHAQAGVWSFDIAELSKLSLTGPAATAAFIFFMVAFAIKIPLFPFHTWLPDAYTEAPTAATFVLSAIMAKIGVYGVIRFVLPIFAEDFTRYALILCYSGVIGMMYCGIAAIGQKDFKRMLAFSSASHMGIIAVGVFCMNLQALTGTLYQIVAHATSTGVLFLLLGIIEERMETRTISDLGGIAYKAPIFAVFFAVAMLASVGLPGTSGFIGEFLIILGAVKFNMMVGVLAGTTLIIGVCYMLWMFQRVFFEKSNTRTEGFKDLSAIETLTILPIVVLIIVMGIYPQPFLARITPAAAEHLAAVSTVQQQLADTTVPVMEQTTQKN
ncbi:complex I subunit 4 family protein [Desulfopila aestuarii]|uniref:NADH dehydrogenase subunit M n=1 Tax=Desulfopila aestuarii DSM 18488 TaxID=1121416 RepID=A0A1M7XZQ2_9BACT|nr:NADH-quinone oxidoreductase subunit M [Desulfopila aestuarii]SHO44740.1 NADH dehydrogenase subunit M [Desulfopila aestuarii DSM 18488]